MAVLLLSPVFLTRNSTPFISIPNADAISRNISLDGRAIGWNSTTTRNPDIRVTQGDTVTLSLSSSDGAPHQFYVDLDGNSNAQCPEEKCSSVFSVPTSPKVDSFTVDFSARTYTYYCSIHQGQMHGNFIVEGFTIASTPSSLRIFRGSSDTSTISVTSVNGFSGDVSLSATVFPSGPSASIDPSVTVSSISPGTATLTVSTTDTTVTGSYAITVTGVSGSSSSTLDVPASVVADFSMSIDPTMLVIPLDSSRSSTIMLGSLGRFSGSIDLTTSFLPSGTTVMFSPNPVPLPAGGTPISTMDVTASMSATPGTYMIDVVGTNGTLQHTTPVTLVVGQDFGIFSIPATLSIVPGRSGTSTITVASFNSFTGTVDLSVTGSPSGLALSINPLSVTVPPDETITAVLNSTALAATQAGNYTVTVTGTGGSMSHSTSVTVSVQDFSIMSSVDRFTLSEGSSGTAMISLTSINGFTGSVGLATAASTASILLVLNVTTVSLSPSGTGFASLALNAGSAPAGNYTVTVTGTVGSLVHSASITITVPPPVIDGGLFYLPIIAVVGIGAIAIAAVYLLRRGRSRKQGLKPA